VAEKELGALLKFRLRCNKSRKSAIDHYNISSPILMVADVVDARGGCGETKVCSVPPFMGSILALVYYVYYTFAMKDSGQC
jgi:hypothetical protein